MTVQDVTNTIDYTGDDVQTSFSFVFRVDDVSWVDINFLTDFDQVTLNADQDDSPGGSVSYTVAPPTGQLVRITRITPQDQELDYTRYDPFDSESHEDALDKLTMQVQDLQEQIDGFTSDAVIVDGTVDNSFLRWNLGNNAYEEFFTYIFPLADGNAGDVIETDGAGTLSFQPGATFPLLAPDGSETAPSYSFANENQSGFFKGVGTRVNVTIDGSERFTFDQFNGGTFGGTTNGTAAIRNALSSASGANVHANNVDINTGVGWEDDTFIGVAGGFNCFRYRESGNEIQQLNDIEVGITASTTQTQGEQVLANSYNEVDIVANPDDVVTAMLVEEGMRLIIWNRGANDLQVFPRLGDNLGSGVDVSVTVVPGATLKARGMDNINWHLEQNSLPSGATGGAVSGAKAYHNVTQSIPDNTETTVIWNDEAFDTDSVHDTVTNNSRLTVPPGVTRIKLIGHVMWPNNASAWRELKFRKNGAGGAIDDDQTAAQTQVQLDAGVTVAPGRGQQIMSGTIRAAAGDYFEVRARHNATVALILAANESWFEMRIIE